jgi:HAD superfamily hydrolase (TIGR01509 family)
VGIRAVILDVDGTLIQSNEAHARAFVQAGKELGYEVDFQQVVRLIGMGSDKLIPRIFGVEKESEEGKRIDERKGEIFKRDLLPGLSATPGARDLLVHLRGEGYTLVIATSASPDDLELLLEQAGIQDLLSDDMAASPAQVNESKPAPDVVHAALEKAACTPDEAVMIGDTPYDVEAASSAGVPIIAVRSGGWSDSDLHGAVAIFDDPAELNGAILKGGEDFLTGLTRLTGLTD